MTALEAWQDETVIVVVSPGQGSQTPGFLSPWLELDGVAERVAAFSEASGVDLEEHGTRSDADTIRDTQIAQPLIVAASLIAWEQLSSRVETSSFGVAGHSVGELASLAEAGVFSTDDALRLVGVRGRAMAEAAALEPTGMSAIVGGIEEQVLELLAELDLTPANYNGAGQIVAAGALPALAALSERAPRGARVIPLQVAGAFHTAYMQPAVETLRLAAHETAVEDPSLTLWTNRDGSIVTSGRQAIDLLVGQVASPVRWDLCMASFAGHGIEAMIELTPGGTLTGLAKRGLKGVPAVAIKTPEDLDAAAVLVAETRSAAVDASSETAKES